MPHPEVENHTKFAFAPQLVGDEAGRPLLVLVIKATYDLRPKGVVALAEQQLPVNADGESWGKPGESSFRFEPEVAWSKPGTDVVLVGHAWAPRTGIGVVDASFSVGSAYQVARVFGERVWYRSVVNIRATDPQPFEKIPLTYERAFGGWDRSDPDESAHQFDPRNPVGVGFRNKKAVFEERALLPNVEDPSQLMATYLDRPEPVGFGFTCPHWQPRAALAGTYDEAWSKTRQPLLPEDFDRRFFNAASPGLLFPGRLRGDEPVRGQHVDKTGVLAFDLPGQPPPTCRVGLKGREDEHRTTELDTVIVDTDARRLLLLWRTEVVLSNGPHDLTAIEISAEGARLRKPGVQG